MYQVKYALVNESNQNQLGIYFSDIKPYLNKYWIVKLDGLYGLYEMFNLTKILECEWEKITVYENGFLVSKLGLCGWHNLEGKCILPCAYEKISSHPFCIVAKETNGKVGAFNHDGLQILDFTWEKILPYPKALIATRNKKSTVFNYYGEKIPK